MNGNTASKTEKRMSATILTGRLLLLVEIVLTFCIFVVSIPITLSSQTREAYRFAEEVRNDYNTVIDGYITTYKMLHGQIVEEIEKDPSFEEMQDWLRAHEEAWKEQIGADVYDGIAITYKGGYAHSWNYGAEAEKKYETYDPSTRPWYQQAQDGNGEAVVVAPYVTFNEAAGDSILMTIAQKYNDEISFDYDIRVAGIERLLTGREINFGGDMGLYDKDGYILSSSQPDYFAHNIYTTDAVITQPFSEALQKSADSEGRLTVARVNGDLKLLYSMQDQNGNTICLMYPFWSVIFTSLGWILLIVLLLIALEIVLYIHNRRQMEIMHQKDARTNQILDATYSQRAFVDLKTMRFSGNEEAAKRCHGDSYEVLYKYLRSMMPDERTKEELDSFISPDALLANGNTDIFCSKRFNLLSQSNGKREPLVYEICTLPSNAANRRVVSIFGRDVTEDAETLRNALHAAQLASRAKGEFLARMSHEIRTPMNAIIGETTLAQYDLQDQDKVRECLSKVMISSKHLLGLINDILDMSAIENNKMHIAQMDFDIKDVVSTITTLYYSQCKQKGITFETKLEHITTEMLVGDQLRLQQIILNLLSNAVKFTEAGGKIIFGLNEEQLPDKRVLLHIFVQDTGCGMSEEYLARIFKPFEQESALTAKEHGGSGLGLAITKQLTELMGGSISVKSKQNVGTVFNVELPCTVSDNQIRFSRSAISHMRAIIVDDEQSALDYASSVMNHIGIAHDCVQNGEEAVSIITKARNDGKMYDICLIDWKMRGETGIELAQRIRRSCGERTIIILASAYDLNEIQDDATKAGVDACIAKPLFQSTLFDIIMTISKGKFVNDSDEHHTYDFSGKRILVADDNSTNLEVAKGYLRKVGCQVDCVNDGAECIHVFDEVAPGTYQATVTWERLKKWS